MSLKVSVGAALVFIMAFVGIAEASYDLPKFKIEKERPSKNPKKENVIKSDWKDFSLFKKKLSDLIAENPELSPSSPERIGNDKNLIFVAFYKDVAYFLDRYSIKIIEDDGQKRVWEQHIFPVGEKISGKNARVTVQTFSFDNQKIYNSSRRKNSLDDLTDAEDKNFLQECFRVGYWYAFKEEVGIKK